MAEITGLVVEDAHNTIRAQLMRGGTFLTQAMIYGLTWGATDCDGNVIVEDAPLDKTAVIFDTPQTSDDDGGWTDPTEGFNFRFDVPPEAFPDGNTRTRVKVKIELVDTDAFGNRLVGYLRATGTVAAVAEC